MVTATLPEVPALERRVVDWERHKGDKRPKILPPPGVTWRNPATNRKVGHRYYTRVTTYADAITESYNLTAWKLRRLLKGAANRRDYVLRAASLSLEDRDRDDLDALVELVLEAAGESASLLGTTLHSLTEALDRDEDLGAVPDEVLPDLAAYTALTQGLIAYVHREARVVCDQLETAGTPDGHAHIAEPCPAGCGPEVVHIIDTKTGSIRYPGKMSTQLAIYAHSDLYDPQTGARTPVEVCRRWGAIVHLPVETGEAAPFWLDLEHGWRGAELCGPVREWHRAKADDILRPFATVQPVRVVDGEATRFEPRPASWNPKSPRTPAPEPEDITEALRVELARALVPAAVSEPRAPVAGVQSPAEMKAVIRDAVVRDVSLGRAPASDLALVGAEGARCVSLDLSLDPGARQCERAAGHEGACEFPAHPTPAERCAHELLVGQCAMPTCRPDLAHLTDEGVEREQLTEIPADESGSQHESPIEVDPGTTWDGERWAPVSETPVEPEVVQQLVEIRPRDDGSVEFRVPVGPWPGVDDVPIASGPDSDAEDGEDVPHGADPIAEAITRCVTTRDLELLGTREWRSWQAEHRKLAAEVHDRLSAAEAAERPRAAFEAALAAARGAGDVAAAVDAAEGQPWLDEALLDRAAARWHELRGRVGA